MVSNMYIFLTPVWEKMSNLTNIFQMGWFNHQVDTINEEKSGTPLV